MMGLDNFIFDSQFEFLKDQEKLKTMYFSSVLDKAIIYKGKTAEAYFRNETWDTENFGKNFGRLLWLSNTAEQDFYNQLEQEFKKWDCCYVRLNANHSFNNWAASKSKKLLSVKISQHLNVGLCNFSFDENLNYINYKELTHDRQKQAEHHVLQMAKGLFNHNRFRSDSFFSQQMIDTIYNSWIKNELKSVDCDLYLIYKESELVSFFLYRPNISPISECKIGFVSLIASSPAFRDKPYASNLLNYVLQMEKQNGTAYVVANTESGNLNAIRFFKNNSFIQTSSLSEYHIWN